MKTAQSNLKSIHAPAIDLTPADHRMLRIFHAVPESGRQGFIELMELIGNGCDWTKSAEPASTAQASTQANVIALPEVTPRIDEIALFGSQKLQRARDGRAWTFTKKSAKPEALTMRESMFINAALNAGRIQ